MDEEEEINASGFMISDDDDEPLELDDEVGGFKFDEEVDDDPEDKFH